MPLRNVGAVLPQLPWSESWCGASICPPQESHNLCVFKKILDLGSSGAKPRSPAPDTVGGLPLLLLWPRIALNSIGHRNLPFAARIADRLRWRPLERKYTGPGCSGIFLIGVHCETCTHLCGRLHQRHSQNRCSFQFLLAWRTNGGPPSP